MMRKGRIGHLPNSRHCMASISAKNKTYQVKDKIPFKKVSHFEIRRNLTLNWLFKNFRSKIDQVQFF